MDENESLTEDRSHHAKHFNPCQSLAKPNSFWDICKKLLSDPYVLFLVMAAIFFKGTKIPSLVLCRIPQGTFIPSWVSIGQVVSEEKSFEKNVNNDDRHQVMAIAHMAIGQVY